MANQPVTEGETKELSVLWITFAVCGALALFLLTRNVDLMHYEDRHRIYIRWNSSSDNIKTEVAGTDTDTDKFETQSTEKSTEVELSEDVRKGDSAASELYNTQEERLEKEKLETVQI